MGKGISKEIIIMTAISLIEEKNHPFVTLGEVARRLEIKTPSLYNHIEGLEQLNREIIIYSANVLSDTENKYIKGKTGEDALYGIFYAYKEFMKNHEGLYRVIMNISKLEITEAARAADIISKPLFTVLDSFGLGVEESVHYSRIIRSIINGFLVQKKAGFFTKSEICLDKSYDKAIKMVISSIKGKI